MPAELRIATFCFVLSLRFCKSDQRGVWGKTACICQLRWLRSPCDPISTTFWQRAPTGIVKGWITKNWFIFTIPPHWCTVGRASGKHHHPAKIMVVDSRGTKVSFAFREHANKWTLTCTSSCRKVSVPPDWCEVAKRSEFASQLLCTPWRCGAVQALRARPERIGH